MKIKPILIVATGILLVNVFLLVQSKSAIADSKQTVGQLTGTVGYSPLTLAAFKTAAKLKTRYSNVIWFNHVNNKTYFYVIKGKSSEIFFPSHHFEGNSNYKMGLVNPDLKEIIPVEYDLIHNISGTIKGLIEVEKGDKKGLYNLDGKKVVPAEYNDIFPLKDDENLALLRKNDDYFYLKSDFTITGKLRDFNIATVLLKIKSIGNSYTLKGDGSNNIMEYNSREYDNSIVIPPSYLVELRILPNFLDFKNPLRHYGTSNDDNYYGYLSYAVKAEGAKPNGENWLERAFHSLVNDYVDARFQFYQLKNVVVADKKQNRILGYTARNYFGFDEGTGITSGKCNENSLRAVNDTLFEFKTTGYLDLNLFNEKDTLKEGPYYHYLHIQNGKLEALNSNRIFNCTQFVKMDDSYFDGCFVVNKKAVDHMTPEILQYMKNEIYASYHYQFKKARWIEVFAKRFQATNKGGNANVEEFLSPIEKYNVAWINSKLNKAKPSTLIAK